MFIASKVEELNYLYLQSLKGRISMYINKCTKCGAEFETKNPKRVICPSCLYPDKKPILNGDSPENTESSIIKKAPPLTSYSAEAEHSNERKPYRNPDFRGDRNQRPFNKKPFNKPQGERSPYPQNQNRNNSGGYAGNRPPQRGGYAGNRPPQRGGFNRPSRPQRPKQLLVSKEQIAQIEILYKKTLPLPNPDIHEVIGAAIELEPRKVFFGINLVRQKMMLPKLPFPKRKLAVSQDQLFAIKSLYEPLLPLPPIGCHKIIAAQLKMDEWRVHVGIGLVRKQMGLDRWNPDRPDAPKEFKK